MTSALDTVKQYINVREQRMLLFIGLYLVVGLIGYVYIFEIGFLATVIVMAWHAHGYISEFIKETIDPAGRYVFITGCDSGFGLASAKAIRALGFRVIAGCYDDNSAGARELKARSWVDKVEVINLDVASEISVEAAIKEVREICQDQGLWALINNAGINSMGPSELVSMVMYHKVAEVNLFGAIRVTKACLPLIRQANGRVVNVTSERGFNPWKDNSSYCITKFGLEAYSACLKREMVQFGVKVITVAPGAFAAATAITDSKMNDGIREDLLVQHSLMSLEDQTKVYAKESIEQLGTFLDKEAENPGASKTPAPVTDAYIDAILNKNPKACYYVHGNGRFGLDPLLVMARLRPFIPLSVVGYVEQFVFTIL